MLRWVVILSAALLATACGDGDGDTVAPVETVTVTAEPPEPSESTSTPAEPELTPAAPGQPGEPVQFRFVMASDVAPCGAQAAGATDIPVPPAPTGTPTGTPSASPSLDRRADDTRPEPIPADCALFDGEVCPIVPSVPVPTDRPVVLCGDETDGSPATKYLLSPALIVGGVSDAAYGIPQNQVAYAVTFELDGASRDTLETLSTTWTPDVDQFAIVVDGAVVSAPTFSGPIVGGEAQITGDFSADEARALAEAIVSGG